jgi:hypothetical protein
MNRRQAIKTGVAAAAAVPFLRAASWKPLLFTPQQNDTVIALTDLIIPATDTPGAKAAQVNRYIDLLLHDGPASMRGQFLKGLKLLDEESVRREKAPFLKLPALRQTALLESFEAEGKGEAYEFFRMAKSITSRVYFETEAGFKELNKNGVPKTWACAHPGRHE